MSRALQTIFDEVRPMTFGFGHLFDDILPHFNTNWDVFPKTNIFKHGTDAETVVIEMALAGYTKDDISVEREDNLIRIKGKKVDRELDESATVVRQDIAMRSFERTLPISEHYKDIDVKFENGLLSIVLEKEPEKEHKPRLIEIK